MSQEYQWFVARGRVAIRAMPPGIRLELDPEGSACCVLTQSDAVEISQIIEAEARGVWEASGRRNGDPALVEGDIRCACRILCNAQEIELIVHNTEPLIAVKSAPGETTIMDIESAVALVQVINHMVATLEGLAQ